MRTWRLIDSSQRALLVELWVVSDFFFMTFAFLPERVTVDGGPALRFSPTPVAGPQTPRHFASAGPLVVSAARMQIST